MSSMLLMLEFHDANFEGITIDCAFAVRISFSSLNCFYATGSDSVAEVWTCSAELLIDGPQKVVVKRPVHECKSVSDFEITPYGAATDDLYNLTLLGGARLASARLLLEGDASIDVEGGVARITLGDHREFLETTEWP